MLVELIEGMIYAACSNLYWGVGWWKVSPEVKQAIFHYQVGYVQNRPIHQQWDSWMATNQNERK